MRTIRCRPSTPPLKDICRNGQIVDLRRLCQCMADSHSAKFKTFVIFPESAPFLRKLGQKGSRGTQRVCAGLRQTNEIATVARAKLNPLIIWLNLMIQCATDNCPKTLAFLASEKVVLTFSDEAVKKETDRKSKFCLRCS